MSLTVRLGALLAMVCMLVAAPARAQVVSGQTVQTIMDLDAAGASDAQMIAAGEAGKFAVMLSGHVGNFIVDNLTRRCTRLLRALRADPTLITQVTDAADAAAAAMGADAGGAAIQKAVDDAIG